MPLLLLVLLLWRGAAKQPTWVACGATALGYVALVTHAQVS
jgi:hypothetical protein